MIIEKELIKTGFKRCIKTYDKNAIIQKDIAKFLLEVLKKNIDLVLLKNIFEIGAGSGFLTKELIKILHSGTEYNINDLVEDYSLLYDEMNYNFVKYMGDAEIIEYPKNLDLIISSNSLQWINDKENILNKFSGAIKKGGYLAFSTFSTENLKEIRNITGKGLKYFKKETVEKLLLKKFDLLYIEEKVIELIFDTPMQVLIHLKSTGVNRISDNFWKKSDLDNFCKEYRKRYSTKDGKVKLTYNPMWFLARRK